MAQSMLSNQTLTLKTTITTVMGTSDTFEIFETGIVLTRASIVFRNKLQLERLVVNIATDGVCTIVLRGLDKSQTKTEVPANKKERTSGAEGYITVLASDLLDVDNTGDEQVLTGNVKFTGNVDIDGNLNVDSTLTAGTLNLTNLSVSGKSKPVPKVTNTTARDALYSTPVDGNMVDVESIGLQYYKTSAGGWVTLDEGTPTPDATEAVKGKAKLATDAESIDDTNDVTIMTPKKTKYKLDRYVITEELTAGEVMSANEGYRRGNTVLNLVGDTISHTGSAYTSFTRIGYDTTEQKQGQSFVATNGGILTSISTENYKTGLPTGNITVLLRTAAGGGTVVATATNTIAESTLSTSSASPTTCVFTFANQRVTAGTYYIEQYCDRANSTTNYSNWALTNNAYAGGIMYNINSSDVWSSPVANDHKFGVVLSAYTEVVTKFYKALNTTNKSTILGLVKSSVVADATFTALKKGYVKGFTGLTVGSPVFLQADGTITQTITNKKLGEATASDTIYLDIDKHQESMVITRDTSLATGVVTYNHTLGEKPIFVTANSFWANSGASSLSTGMGTYNGSTQLSNLASYNNGTLSSANLITSGSTITAYQTGFIQNITNNTFDINWTKVSTPTGTATIFLTLSL